MKVNEKMVLKIQDEEKGMWNNHFHFMILEPQVTKLKPGSQVNPL